MKTLIEKCEYAKIAQNDLRRSVLMGRGTLGVQSYFEAGCLTEDGKPNCDGYRDDCEFYFSYDKKFLEWEKEYGK